MEKTVIICDLCEKEIENYHILILQAGSTGNWKNPPVQFHVGFECENKPIKDLIIKKGKSK